MQLLTTTNVYDVENDFTDLDFLKIVENPPTGYLVIDGNAGLGADWPARIWKNLNGIAIALAIISAPSTIEDNWPKWKEIFDDLTQKVLEFHGEYRIDRDTAHILALHYAVNKCGLKPDTLSIHMAVRHFSSSYPGYEDLLECERLEMNWFDLSPHGSKEFQHGVRSNEEAAKQACCRYIFGIQDFGKCVTIVVEQDGTISFARAFDLNREWG